MAVSVAMLARRAAERDAGGPYSLLSPGSSGGSMDEMMDETDAWVLLKAEK